MRIAEIYKSLQGEGLLTETESVFVRVSGCNLRCSFCDTPYASWTPEGEDLSVGDIVSEVGLHDCRHVVLTGGEPMLFAELIPLCEQLRAAGNHLTIETAGTLYLPVECDLMSISPKLSNSTPSAEVAQSWHLRHETTRSTREIVDRLAREHVYQLKFVIETLEDCDEVVDYLRGLGAIDRQRVLLMPQGTDREALTRIGDWLEPYCRRHNFRFCPRRHIEWFGLVRGT